MKNRDRERAIEEITSRITNRIIAPENRKQEGDTAHKIMELINDTLFEEKKRLKTERPSKRRDSDLEFWNSVQKKLPKANERELKALLISIIRRFAREIAGNFNPRVYQLAVKVLPPGLSLLLNGFSIQKSIKQLLSKNPLEKNIILAGETKAIQSLEKKGTIILVPTHLSNLDSPVVGWSIYRLGLPPFTYGAGLNLFYNPVLSFFMHNLGAYKVDRRKKAPLYKEVLKEYATCSLEYGYHNLFFPGGTRSRSGALERKLKKGLLGTGLKAYINNLRRKKKKPNIYIVPATINYHLVLEAKTLIEDALKEEGKRRYIIDDDESSDWRKIYQFATKLITLDGEIQIVFGQPLDPFGNIVDEDGISRDPHGRPIDITRYVSRHGQIIYDDQRDREYTNELAQSVVKQYEKYNTIMVTHLVAHSAFKLLREKNPEMDLFRLIHTGGFISQLSILEVCEQIDRDREKLRKLYDDRKLLLESRILSSTPEELLHTSLKFFQSYHTPPVLQRKGDHIVSENIEVLYYYNNRLRGYMMSE